MSQNVYHPRFCVNMHGNYKEKQDYKNIQNVTRCRDNRSAKSRETVRDDSIQQFSSQLDPTYLSTVKYM